MRGGCGIAAISMQQSNESTLNDIRCSWNIDAFVIDPRLLFRKCKELANQQKALAKRLKQPCDVTAERLVALYKKQRGRCAISGVPLTYSPGEREQTSINLDHIKNIERGRSLDSVAAGGASVGGNAGMMDNLRFVCQAMHYIRDRLEQVSPEFGDLRARLAVWFELGSPCNQSVSIDDAKSFATSSEDVERAIDAMTDRGRQRITVRQITQRLTATGLQFSYAHVLRYVRNLYGCEPKSMEQRQRVAAACSMLYETPSMVDTMKTNKRWFSRLDANYLALLSSVGIEAPKKDARAEDLCVAYEVVTGKVVPSITKQSSNASECVKRKLKFWARPTAMTRMKVFCQISATGKAGIEIATIEAAVISSDELARVVGGNAYANELRSSIGEIIEDLVYRRWIDVNGGVCIARLRLHEAAEYCGHTPETLRKYHKVGIGPKCDLARFGHGRQLSFSYVDLDEWMMSRKVIRRVQPSNGVGQEQQLIREVSKHEFLFDA